MNMFTEGAYLMSNCNYMHGHLAKVLVPSCINAVMLKTVNITRCHFKFGTNLLVTDPSVGFVNAGRLTV